MHSLMVMKKNKNQFPKYFLFHIFLVSSFQILFPGNNSTFFFTLSGINFLQHFIITVSETKQSLSAADSSKNFVSNYIHTLFLVSVCGIFDVWIGN